MRSYTIPQTTGNDAAAEHAQRQQARSQLELQIYDSEDITVRQTTRGLRLYLRKRIYPQPAAKSGLNPRGEYDPTASYAVFDLVVIRSGANAGSFYALRPSSGVAPQIPDTGNLYWLSLSGNAPVLGAWMT